MSAVTVAEPLVNPQEVAKAEEESVTAIEALTVSVAVAVHPPAPVTVTL